VASSFRVRSQMLGHRWMELVGSVSSVGRNRSGSQRGDDMRVRVDDDRCEGHGRCYAVAPELFEPDEIGNGVAVGDGTVASGMERAARLAAENCPEQAIVIEDDA